MKPPRLLSSPDFWRGAVIVVLAFLMVWLFLENRRLIASNERALDESHAQLVRLCDTTTALDLAVVLPLLVETRNAVDFYPPGPERERALRLARNLRVAHEELSSTTLCDRVQ